PIRASDRGGFGVALWAERDHQVMRFNQPLFVPWDDKELQLSFSTFRDKLRPGGKESWRITVKGHDGKAAEAGTAELLAYMYDRSLDAFADHSPPSSLSLYPYRAGVAWTQATVGQAQIRWVSNETLAEIPEAPAFHGDQLRFFDDYGIGGPGARAGFAF